MNILDIRAHLNEYDLKGILSDNKTAKSEWKDLRRIQVLSNIFKNIFRLCSDVSDSNENYIISESRNL